MTLSVIVMSDLKTDCMGNTSNEMNCDYSCDMNNCSICYIMHMLGT